MIEYASLKDIEDITNLCMAVTLAMEERGIFQWDALYPTREIFLQDIKESALYGYWERTQLIGLIVQNQSQEPEYQTIHWTIPSEKVGTVHRLMVRPEAQGQGIATKLLDFAEKRAEEQGMTVIRLDVFMQNPDAVRFYENRGYQCAGSVWFRKGEFLCMEKQLNPI